MKLISIMVIAFFMLGCESKQEIVEPTMTMVTTPQNVRIVQEEQINSATPRVYSIIKTPKIIKTTPVINYSQQEVQTVQETPQLPVGYKEETRLLPIKSNIPKSCQMWSDGCNTCTRAGRNQAECTVYKCKSNLKFSCLQWN